MAIDYEKIAKALDIFKTPIKVQEGDWAIIEGVQYLYRNGEWIIKEPPKDDNS